MTVTEGATRFCYTPGLAALGTAAQPRTCGLARIPGRFGTDVARPAVTKLENPWVRTPNPPRCRWGCPRARREPRRRKARTAGSFPPGGARHLRCRLWRPRTSGPGRLDAPRLTTAAPGPQRRDGYAVRRGPATGRHRFLPTGGGLPAPGNRAPRRGRAAIRPTRPPTSFSPDASTRPRHGRLARAGLPLPGLPAPPPRPPRGRRCMRKRATGPK